MVLKYSPKHFFAPPFLHQEKGSGPRFQLSPAASEDEVSRGGALDMNDPSALQLMESSQRKQESQWWLIRP